MKVSDYATRFDLPRCFSSLHNSQKIIRMQTPLMDSVSLKFGKQLKASTQFDTSSCTQPQDTSHLDTDVIAARVSVVCTGIFSHALIYFVIRQVRLDLRPLPQVFTIISNLTGSLRQTSSRPPLLTLSCTTTSSLGTIVMGSNQKTRGCPSPLFQTSVLIYGFEREKR
jgi:hypothetical protein